MAKTTTLYLLILCKKILSQSFCNGYSYNHDTSKGKSLIEILSLLYHLQNHVISYTEKEDLTPYQGGFRVRYKNLKRIDF